jgi:hypothetical protein
MRFVINSKGEHHHILEELQCPFGEKKDYIILRDDEITYWQNANNYYKDMKLNVEGIKSHIIDTEIHKWRNVERKQKTLNFLRETLAKMIAYEREIKIDAILDKNSYNSLVLAC